MNNKYELVILFLVARNRAGKTKYATTLAEYGIPTFSAREVIKNRHFKLRKTPLPSERQKFQDFAIGQKKKHGAHTFIAESLKQIPTDSKIILFESIRASGEAQWIKNFPRTWKKKKVKAVLIHIDASYEVRLRRYLSESGENNLSAGEVSEEKFNEDETRTNSGTEDWSENISAVIPYADLVVENNTEEDFNRGFNKIISYAQSFLNQTSKSQHY